MGLVSLGHTTSVLITSEDEGDFDFFIFECAIFLAALREILAPQNYIRGCIKRLFCPLFIVSLQFNINTYANQRTAHLPHPRYGVGLYDRFTH
jgi:hypothetical protein